MTRSNSEIIFAGHKLLLDCSGALFWPAANALVAADLHLEKAGFFARFGFAQPRYDAKATLSKLSLAISHYRPARVICLVDGVHGAKAFTRLEGGDKDVLLYMVKNVREWHWVLGNHNSKISSVLSGTQHETLELEGLLLAHQPQPTELPQIIGHYHPKISATVEGERFDGPAFALDSKMLIMPSFGKYHGGLDVRSDAIATLLTSPAHYICHREKIWEL